MDKEFMKSLFDYSKIEDWEECCFSETDRALYGWVRFKQKPFKVYYSSVSPLIIEGLPTKEGQE